MGLLVIHGKPLPMLLHKQPRGVIQFMSMQEVTQKNFPLYFIGRVSIHGAGNTSDITYTYNNSTWTNACIRLVSGSEATDGNQSISYIKLDGSSSTAKHGILVRCRKNVKLHHLTIVDFNYNAVIFNVRQLLMTLADCIRQQLIPLGTNCMIVLLRIVLIRLIILIAQDMGILGLPVRMVC